MRTHCNHGNAWPAKLGRKKVRLQRTTGAHSVRFTVSVRRARTQSFATAALVGKPETSFPQQCGRRSVQACGTVCVARGKPMACGHAVAAAYRRSLKSVLATSVSRTGSNTARTAGSHAWPSQGGGMAGTPTSESSTKSGERKEGTDHSGSVGRDP